MTPFERAVEAANDRGLLLSARVDALGAAWLEHGLTYGEPGSVDRSVVVRLAEERILDRIEALEAKS